MRKVPTEIISKAQIAHEAIHDINQKYATVDGRIYPIMKYRNGCRYIDLDGYVIMEQNKNKTTLYAKRAQQGEHLSWIIPVDPNVTWHLLEDVPSSKSR